jgi:hypothetical protein
MPKVARLLRDAPLRMRAAAVRNMPRAAAYLEAQLRQTCGRAGTEANRSRPGEAPRKQTGAGQASIRARFNVLTLTITVTANRYMARHDATLRPWFGITMRRVGPQFRRLIFGKGN